MLGKKSIRINGADCGIEAIMLGVVTSIGGFLFGYDTGQISGMQIFDDFDRRFAAGGTTEDGVPSLDETPIILSLVVSLMSIGSLIGALSGAYTADWFGRRWSLTFGVAVFVIGNIIQITAMNSWVHMMMGRFIAGLGVGNLSVGVPMYQSECTPREIRGAVVASYQLMITIGILVSNLINYGVREIQEQAASWRIVIGLGIFFSLFLGGGVLLLPESPRWLASRGKWEEAKISMARLRGMKETPDHELVTDDFQEMHDSMQEQKQAGTGSWLECFTGTKGKPRILYRTILGMFIHFLQQWTGVNYFFYYGANIFESAGIDDPILIQLILGAVNVATTFPGLYIVERFGRRMPLFIGGLWQATWLCIFAAVGIARPPVDYESSGIVMIVAACMFIASFAMTWGPFAWAVIGETFPLRTRAKQASIATAGNWLGNFMISFLTPLADDGIGYGFGFVFLGTNLAAAIMVYLFLYETKSLALEQVDVMYSQKDLKAWNSSKWMPAGYLDRNTRDPNYFAERRRSSAVDAGTSKGEKHADSDQDADRSESQVENGRSY